MMENASAGCGVAHVSATVLIAQRVPPGRERVYRHWQNRTRYIVETFDGFERKEVYRPGSAADRERVTAYRFAGLGRLTTWLRSEAGRSVLAESTSLFEKPPTLEIRLGTPWQEHGSMVISHDLQPERTEDFLYWQQRLLQEQEKFPGFGGAELYQPEKDAQQRWVVSFFYRTGAHLRVWLESEVRASLLDEGMDYLVTTRDRSPASDGTWPLEHQVESAGVARQITNMVLGNGGWARTPPNGCNWWSPNWSPTPSCTPGHRSTCICTGRLSGTGCGWASPMAVPSPTGTRGPSAAVWASTAGG